MRVEYSDLALAGVRRHISDPSRQMSCFASLLFYLGNDARANSVPCPAFPDVELYVYPFMNFRVLYQVKNDVAFVWSFLEATPDHPDL
jgi:hypothetical protein